MKNIRKHLRNSDRETLPLFCKKYTNIYIYGAGKTGTNVVRFLEEIGITVKGFIVSAGHEKTDWCGYPVFKLQELNLNSNTDGIILATLDHDNLVEMKQNLYEHKQFANTYRMSNIILPSTYVHSLINQNKFAAKNRDWYIGDTSAGPYFDKYTELDRVGIEMGTDKASVYHNYLCKYELFLSQYKNDSITLLELGVCKGQSLNMWKKYFPHADIVGVDIDKLCLEYDGENKKVLIMDLSETKNLEQLADLNPTIIIDDASHIWSHQIEALCILFKSLPHGGIYILEDLHTSFWQGTDYDDAVVTAYDVCSKIAEVVTSGYELREDFALKDEIEEIAAQIDMISFIKSSCIMVKK